MSTEVMNRTLESYIDDLTEYITDENLDILDEFTAEITAFHCISIARWLIRGCKVYQRSVLATATKKVYHIKVNNTLLGFVSVSDDNGTGVSNTEYYPFWSDEEDGYFVGLCSLAQMINEAWYLCNNNE